MVLLLLLGLPALYGGWSLMAAGPGQDALGMKLSWLKGSPFASYFIPGMVLFGLFGIGSMVTAFLGLLRHWAAPYLAFTIGVAQMIWIAVQLAVITEAGIFVLQPVMFATGALIAGSAYLWHRAGRG